ncbi:hypothetical protein EVAR_23115_1 [Eumeta japonica]|uniref:Uncharacterized protein n=1 Tax=Eumeta variegata TaxID=151549 RepID=A0A4C1VAW7_EUMVA|nr:hypothetical protein EVAR_23115_1 [Eumeta japonica]
MTIPCDPRTGSHGILISHIIEVIRFKSFTRQAHIDITAPAARVPYEKRRTITTIGKTSAQRGTLSEVGRERTFISGEAQSQPGSGTIELAELGNSSCPLVQTTLLRRFLFGKDTFFGWEIELEDVSPYLRRMEGKSGCGEQFVYFSDLLAFDFDNFMSLPQAF